MNKKKKLTEMYEFSTDGRMLDYGHEKSDSREGKMAKSALSRVSQLAGELDSILQDEDDLPQWVHYKISTSADRIQSVHNYLTNKISRMHEGDVDQNQDGENDFDDVQIARMKASGMTIADIEAKHPELFEAKKKGSGHPKQYGAPEGSKRDRQLDQTKADFKKAKELRKAGKTKQAKELEQKAYRRRDRMEKEEREKKGYKSKPRKDTKAEAVSLDESQLREYIRHVVREALSKKTKETLRKKAEKRGLTPGSVYKEFEKGLAAYASSGSRKGMTAHQWAHARVNSATPSKPWAVVKKSKAKKKKKK